MPKSLFTSRHHITIATAIRESRAPSGHDEVDVKLLLGILIATFRMDNPKFDPGMFRMNCGDRSGDSD